MAGNNRAKTGNKARKPKLVKAGKKARSAKNSGSDSKPMNRSSHSRNRK